MWELAVGSAIGGLAGMFGSKSAGKAQAAAAQQAAATQKYMFDESVRLNEPWRQAGTSALYQLEDLMGLSTPESRAGRGGLMAPKREDFMGRAPVVGTSVASRAIGTGNPWVPSSGKWTPSQPTFDQAGYDKALADYNSRVAAAGQTPAGFGSLTKKFSLEDFEKDPGYEFRLGEGVKAIDRSAVARGGLNSGATLKALTRFGQDYGSNEYQNSYNRYNADNDRLFNRYGTIAGIGQTATRDVAQAGTNFGNNLASLQVQQGNARGAGIMGMTNSLVGGINQGINAYQSQQYLDMLKSRPYTMDMGGGAYDWSRYN